MSLPLHPNYPDVAELWGWKTQAWFDVWSIEHFFMGIGLGGIAFLLRRTYFKANGFDDKTARRLDLLIVMCFSYFWETIEHYLEAGAAAPGITFWFQGVEFWGNRLITDPLMVYLGWLAYCRYPKIQLPSRLFSLGWLYVHIFVFPHSMYLHEWLQK